MYKLGIEPLLNQVTTVIRSDGWAIPINPENTDYLRFKKDLQDGAELQDAEGKVMAGDVLTTFIGTLP